MIQVTERVIAFDGKVFAMVINRSSDLTSIWLVKKLDSNESDNKPLKIDDNLFTISQIIGQFIQTIIGIASVPLIYSWCMMWGEVICILNPTNLDSPENELKRFGIDRVKCEQKPIDKREEIIKIAANLTHF